MICVAIFFPAFITILCKNNNSKTSFHFKMILEYGVDTILITLITQIVITYIWGVQNIVQDALQSFPFFIKYIVIAGIVAIALAVLQKVYSKYIEISVKVEAYDEKEETK